MGGTAARRGVNRASAGRVLSSARKTRSLKRGGLVIGAAALFGAGFGGGMRSSSYRNAPPGQGIYNY
jgi:hypothetical protein